MEPLTADKSHKISFSNQPCPGWDT